MIDLIVQVLILVISVAFISSFSKLTIDNAIKLSRMTHIGELVIGFILLSFATSAPELAVSFSAITSHNVGISIGNLLGSNVANLALVLGIPALMTPLTIGSRSYKKLMSIIFLSSMIPLLLFSLEEVGRMMGFILIGIFILFSAYLMKKKITLELTKKEPKNMIQRISKPFEFYMAVAMLAIGIIGTLISSSFVVSSASKIASMIGISQTIIGATIVAIGTSMPELSITIQGIRKERYSLILGNTIGSCLTNLTLILGIVLLMSPITVNFSIFSTLIIFVVASTLITWYFAMSGRKIDRMEGLTLVFLYMIFLMFTFGVQFTVLEFLKT